MILINCVTPDSFDDFIKSGAMITGINDGSIASHKAFQSHYKLPFTLLSDSGNKVYDLFGVKGKLLLTSRKTLVVDFNGKIVYTHEAVLTGQEHADDAIKFIRASLAKH